MLSLTAEFEGTPSALRLFGSPPVLRIRCQESVLCLLSLVIKVLTSFQKFTFSMPLFCNYILYLFTSIALIHIPWEMFISKRFCGHNCQYGYKLWKR